MKWKVEYYSEELREKIFSLPLGTFAKYEMIVERLEKYGPNVQRLPHMRHLVNGLWESARSRRTVPHGFSTVGGMTMFF